MTVKKRRILLISSNSSGRGGGEQYLVYLTQGLASLNVEIYVLLSAVEYMDNWAKLLTQAGANVKSLDLVGLKHRPLRFIQSILDIKQQLKIAEFCKEINPDGILVNQQYDEDGLDYLMGALKAQVAPVAGTIHLPMTADKNKRLFGKMRGNILSWWYKKNPYALILVSEGSQKEFEAYYKYPRPTYVVNNGYFTDEYSESKDFESSNIQLNLPPDLPIIGTACQFSGPKNLELLVDSYLWLRKQGVDSYLLLIGDGECRNVIEQELLKSCPRDRWHITGWQNNPEAYFKLLDVYAMTSHFEGLPLALIEAVGRGIPTVITNFNGATDVAKRASWVSIVKEYSPEVFGEQLRKSIQELPQLKRQANDAKISFQDYFSLKRMARETLNILDSL